MELNEYPFVTALGITLSENQGTNAIFEMARNETNVGGVRNSINGGILPTYVEIAAHFIIRQNLRERSEIKHTQDLNIAYLNSAVSKITRAEASLVRMGRTSTVVVELWDGDRTTLFCHARVSCAVANSKTE